MQGHTAVLCMLGASNDSELWCNVRVATTPARGCMGPGARVQIRFA